MRSAIKNQAFLILYGILAIITFLYSFTQVDLSLTLSRVSIWQSIQQWFQYIGYYNRPLSTYIYIGILGAYFILYGIILAFIRSRRITIGTLWSIVICISIILWFSYPALSYDLFNHMFTAKTVLVYQKNPYIVTPLQFTGVEPWLSFLHWTHVVSVFSPLWIVLTLPAYIFGFGFFLLQMWNTKSILVLSYIVSVWAIGKILRKRDEVVRLTGMAVFALNPLVIIESLVNAHNDMLMMAFALLAVALYESGHRWQSWMALSLSIASKMITFCLIPVFFWRWNKKLAFVTLCITTIVFLIITKREIMPWYFLWILPFAALIESRAIVYIFGFGISAGLMLRYAPFLYFGNWNTPVPFIETWVTIVPIAISGLIVCLRRMIPI